MAQCLPARRGLPVSLKRNRMLVTAFRSPTTVSAFANPIPGSTFPACYFASHDAVSTPVRLSALRLVWFAPCRPLLRFSPLPVPGLALSVHPQSPLPFRTFTSLRIKAFNCVSPDWPAFRFRPISFRSPFPALLLGSNSDHRSRSATLPEACCSSNLLEPLSLCSRNVRSSTVICNSIYIFPQLFGITIPDIYQRLH